jgi:hydrogenase-4 component B
MVSAMPHPLWFELAAALCIAASGIPACLRRSSVVPSLLRATTLNGVGSALGLFGLVLYARGGAAESLRLGALPIGALSFGIDGLSALFLVPVLVISTLGSHYGASYWRDEEHPHGGRRLRLCWGVMTAAMMGVVLARDSIMFLVAWEAMALAGFFLICSEEELPEVRQAAWTYLVATHAGTLCLVGFFALLGHTSGSSALWPSLVVGAGSGLATALFALGVAGFGLKAGLVPLHVWLPGAHANAPSHVSALLSGVLLKMGVYGIVRVCGLLIEPPLWWGGSLLVVGALTAVFGIALAVAQQDLKRLLAYSSIENIGVIAIGVGLASLGRSLGREECVVLGLGGALLHALNHSLFKPLLFFCAGGVLHATGSRQISSLGGLARTMPRSFALFAVGAVAICGLPPLNGFAGELLLYVGLLRTAGSDAGQGGAWASAAVPALALTGALALAAFVKVLGIAFVGTPRTPAAARAHDPGPGMLVPMAVLAAACVAIGLAPVATAPLLRAAIGAWDPVLESQTSLAALVPLYDLSLMGLVLMAGAALVAGFVLRRVPARADRLTWDCGYARPTPRMQYVAESFSELLVGLFDWAVRPRRQRPELTRLFPPRSHFASEVRDPVLGRIVEPLAAAVGRGLSPVRALQRGPIQLYLFYVFLIVVILLMVAP